MTADQHSGDMANNISKMAVSTLSTTTASMTNVSKPRTADGGDGIFTGFVVNDGMIMRVTYVLLGLTFILVVYFGIKFWRLRRRKTNIRRYDVLTTQRVATDIGIESGSDDELFDDAQAKLVRNTGNGSGGGGGTGRLINSR